MLSTLRPWQLLVVAAARWVNRDQQAIISYLQEENRVLREHLGKKRLLLTDDQRRRLAAKGKLLGHRILGDIASIVSPDTILAWHRRLIARKWDHSDKRRGPGRPGVMRQIADALIRMARENPDWGYSRIQGALDNLGHRVSRTTVANLLKRHWESISAADFLTVEVWGMRGLVTLYVLVVIELSNRRVYFAGATPNPNTE